jgi:hypothetical protein
MSSLYQIEKLEENNYDSWCVQMKCVLVHAELWNVASGDLQQSSAGEGIDWVSLDRKALAMITLSVKVSQLGYIKNCASANAAWIKLRKVHQPS